MNSQTQKTSDSQTQLNTGSTKEHMVQLQLDPTGTALAERSELGASLTPYTDRQPTGIYVEAGEIVTIDVERGQYLSYVIGSNQAYVNANRQPVTGSLKLGQNGFVVQESGILYLQNASTTVVADVSVSVEEKSDKLLTFTLGKDDPANWQKLLADNPDAETIELVGEHALLTVSYDTAKAHVIDPAQTLETWDSFIQIEDRVAGMTDTTSGVGKTSAGLYHAVETDTGFMWATHGVTGYNSSANAAPPMLNHVQIKSNGWGPWHEIGHQHQQSAWTINGTVESTVNVYSQAVSLAFTGKFRRGEMTAGLAFSDETPQTGFQDLQSPWEKLGPYNQLFWAFGEEFYQQLHHVTRVLKDSEVPEDDLAERDYFVKTASEISGYDLTGFFDQWRLDYTAQARAAVKAMNLKQLPFDLANTAPGNAAGGLKAKPASIDAIRDYEVPEAEANNGIFRLENQDIAASDLVSYSDPDIVSAEIVGTTSRYRFGEQTCYVMIETDKGERNIIPVSTITVPEIYADADLTAIVDKMRQDMQAFSLDAADHSNIETHARMLHAIDEIGDEDLVQFYSAFNKTGEDPAYEAFSNAEAELYQGSISLLFDTDYYENVLTAQGDIKIKFYLNGEYTGEIQEGYPVESRDNNFYAARFIQNDSQTRIVYQNPNIRADDEIRVQFLHRYEGDSTVSEKNIEFLAGDIGTLDLTSSLEKLDVNKISVHAGITRSNEGDPLLVLDRAFFERAINEGDLNISVFKNDTYIGELDENLLKGGAEGRPATFGQAQMSHSAQYTMLQYDAGDISDSDEIRFTFSYRPEGSTNVEKRDVIIAGETSATGPIFGTENDDELTGTDNDDVIIGLGGDDTIDGLAGDDVLAGGDGDDEMYGGDGNNQLFGDAGHDRLYGGADDDLLVGGVGEDTLDGGNGNDVLLGGEDDDQLHGGVGNDRIYGGTGDDRADAGEGDDVVFGDGGADFINGGAGNDGLFGGDGNDTVNGRAGNDYAEGGAGDDLIDGGQSNDQLFGGAGADQLFSNSGDNLLSGDDGNDQLLAGDGSDTLLGGTGNDVLLAGGGKDYLHGGAGDDQVFGGSGHDFVAGNDGNDALFGDDGDDVLFGGAGNDYLVTGAGIDAVIGGQGADLLKLETDGGRVFWSDFEDGIDRIDATFHSGIAANFDQQVRIFASLDGNSTWIAFGDTGILLENVELSQVDAEDFLLG